jgi:hypothetical protein
MADLLSDFLVLVKQETIPSASKSTTISRKIASPGDASCGVLLIDLDPAFPTIAVCCSGTNSDNCGALWKSALNFEMIKYQVGY